MVNLMESHPLLLGLRKRLNSSDIKLKDKLCLITNIYKSSVQIPYKDKHIFNWILSTLDEKYSDSSIKRKDLDKMWGLLSLCLENIDESGTKVNFEDETLLTLLDRAEIESGDTAKSFIHILNISSKWREFDVTTSSLCVKLAKKDACPEVLMTVLLDKISRSDMNKGLFLSYASKHITPSNLDAFTDIFRNIMLKNSTDFEHFFDNIREIDEKYEGTDQVLIFLNYLINQGDLNLVLKSANDPSISLKLRTCLFILTAYLSGQELYAKGESLLLAKISVSLEKKPSIQQVIDNSLPLDLDFLHKVNQSGSDTMTVSRILSEALIVVLDKNGINADTFKTLACVYSHHPTILETLAPLILSRCLPNKDESSKATFSLLVELKMKMRSFPKLISKFMLYQRRISSDSLPTWDPDYLVEIGEAVYKIPRAQCLEIWKTLLFHFSEDFMSRKDEKYWYLLSPLLKVLLTSGLLIDHNVPEPMMVKIKELITTTFKNIVCGLEKYKFTIDSMNLYEEFVSSFLEFVGVVSAYNNTEFSEIEKFKVDLIKSIIKKGKIGGYSQFIVQAVDTHSEFEPDLWRTFHDVLKPLTKTQMPQQFIQVCTETEEMDCDENPAGIALTLHSAFNKIFKSSGQFKNLTDKDLWVNISSWQVKDSELGKILSSEISLVCDKSFKVQCEELNPLPLENLPPVLKLAATILALCSLFDSGSVHSAIVTTRCLEETEIFRFADVSKLLKRILEIKEELPECLLSRLAMEFTWSKWISTINEHFEMFSSELQSGAVNHFHFFTLYLGNLFVVSTKGCEMRSQAISLGYRILKIVIKTAKSDIPEEDLPYHLKAACALLAQQEDIEGKQEKYVKKVIAASSCTPMFTVLVLSLLEVKDSKRFVTKEKLLDAWKCVLDSAVTDESIRVAVKILESLDTDEFNNFLNIEGHDLKLAQILMKIKPSELITEARRQKLEDLLFRLIKMDSIDPDEKGKLLLCLVDARPSPVAGNVEIAAISFLLAADCNVMYCSPNTAIILKTFISRHPTLAPNYAGFLVEAIRLHISHIALPTEDLDQANNNLEIGSSLSTIFETFRKNLSDWKHFAPYIVSDLVTAILTITNQELKQIIVASVYTLLAISEEFSIEYLAANLQPAANEIFKTILEDKKKMARNG